MKKTPTRNRARIEILNFVLQFSTAKYFGAKREGYDSVHMDVKYAFRGGYVSNEKPEMGSLVMLTSAPFTKWYLSWVKDYKEEGFGGSWLLESIEDGSLCWWSNIALYCYPKAESDNHPQWKWDDEQYAFWDRWNRACKKRDAYMTLPVMPEFTEDGGVILGTRTRLFLDGHRPTKRFPNWRKVKVSEMLEFYDYAASSNPT